MVHDSLIIIPPVCRLSSPLSLSPSVLRAFFLHMALYVPLPILLCLLPSLLMGVAF